MTTTDELDLAEVPADDVGDQSHHEDGPEVPEWDGVDESTAEQDGEDQ